MTPISRWSSAVYLLAGAVVVYLSPSLESGVLAVSLAVLAVGAWWFHGVPLDQAAETLDHAGMHLTLGSLATYAVGGPWWLMLVGGLAGAVVLEYRMQVPIKPAMGVYVWVIVVGALTSGAVVPLLIGMAMMGAGYRFWHLHTDLAHSLWHLLTASGLAVLYLGVGP